MFLYLIEAGCSPNVSESHKSAANRTLVEKNQHCADANTIQMELRVRKIAAFSLR
jgi:hypothetical protein